MVRSTLETTQDAKARERHHRDSDFAVKPSQAFCCGSLEIGFLPTRKKQIRCPLLQLRTVTQTGQQFVLIIRHRRRSTSIQKHHGNR